MIVTHRHLYEKGSTNVNRLIPGFFAFILLLGLTATHARADLTITATDANVTPGGTGTMDFSISSTSLTGDMLQFIQLELQITQVSGTSLLQFSPGADQPVPYNSSSYVFYQNSSDASFSLPFWGNPTTTTAANDTISGGDIALSPVTLSTTSGSFLLATVQFQAQATATFGDTFTIGLVPLNNPTPDQSQQPSTYFEDQNGTQIAYTSTPGTVMISSSLLTIVPEPASTITGLTGAALFTAYGLLRLRRSRRQTA